MRQQHLNREYYRLKKLEKKKNQMNKNLNEIIKKRNVKKIKIKIKIKLN
jgi:hypothetical protein